MAKLDETMWTDLFLLNSEALLEEIDVLMGHLAQYRDALAVQNHDALCALLRAGRERKEKSLTQG